MRSTVLQMYLYGVSQVFLSPHSHRHCPYYLLHGLLSRMSPIQIYLTLCCCDDLPKAQHFPGSKTPYACPSKTTHLFTNPHQRMTYSLPTTDPCIVLYLNSIFHILPYIIRLILWMSLLRVCMSLKAESIHCTVTSKSVFHDAHSRTFLLCRHSVSTS